VEVVARSNELDPALSVARVLAYKLRAIRQELGQWREESTAELRGWQEDFLAESVKVWHSLEWMEDLMWAFYLQQGIYVPVRGKETRGVQEPCQEVGGSAPEWKEWEGARVAGKDKENEDGDGDEEDESRNEEDKSDKGDKEKEGMVVNGQEWSQTLWD